jgi:hypothetical protein
MTGGHLTVVVANFILFTVMLQTQQLLASYIGC